ncbi:hypothetical protein B296_00013544 [Ensete ventricosum]|uniref:Uncharacterized protein n=1 Tax=Ensete ventricosum TaxID=4639 RepID=A0A426ZJI2_ENSVE|nr:hypothetical protein B296_00013544 [Ensete ventricosum]
MPCQPYGRCRRPCRLALAGRGRALRAAALCKGPSRSQPPPCRPWLQPAAPCGEIVYPYIPDSDGEDEGGQTSFSLAVSTRWISAAKLLQSDLATLAQREGGE